MSFLQKRNFPIKNLKYGYQKRQKEAADSPIFQSLKRQPLTLYLLLYSLQIILQDYF